MPATPLSEVDRVVASLAERRSAWGAVPLTERLTLLRALGERFAAEAPEIVRLSNQAKGLTPEHPAYDEDWMTTAWTTVRNVAELERSLAQFARTGRPLLPAGSVSQRPTGRTVVRVLPGTFWDRVVFMGYHGEVWMQPGVTPENLEEHVGATLRHPPAPKLGLVLGAGNVGSIGPMDAIYKLFVENEVVVLKMNPVNDYLGPALRRAFGPLVDGGFIEIVYGGAEVGAHLANHPLVETIHITGSDATYDAIVWGPSAGRDERKAKGERVNARSVSAELGNVTPIIVVPGEWSERELQFQAVNVASMVTNNASFNCIAGKLLVVSKDWPQRAAFLDAVRAVLRAVPTRKGYYPGARDRWRRFVDAHPSAELLSAEQPDGVPWTLIPGVDPEKKDDPCLRVEPFCGVLSEVALPGATPVTFLPGAVDFVNESVWGTLSCSVIIHPNSRKEPANEAAFQEALDELRYGAVAVNHWAGIPYGVVGMPWGAFPGNKPEDIGSGAGVVHNAMLFDKPEKSVLYGPFRPLVRPVWFCDHTRGARVGERMTRFELAPSIFKVLPVAIDALLG